MVIFTESETNIPYKGLLGIDKFFDIDNNTGYYKEYARYKIHKIEKNIIIHSPYGIKFLGDIIQKNVHPIDSDSFEMCSYSSLVDGVIDIEDARCGACLYYDNCSKELYDKKCHKFEFNG